MWMLVYFPNDCEFIERVATSKMPTHCSRVPAASARLWSSAACIWMRPELVAEVNFLAWTDDNLLLQVVYEGLREDKPAAEVRREEPHPRTDAAAPK